MSKTDKTRPFWVRMLDYPGVSFREKHQHKYRYILDEDGEPVRIETGEINKWTGKPVTRYALQPFTECDLPASPWEPDERPHKWNLCHYDHTVSWLSSGNGHCGCKMCTGQDWRREERRRERHSGKKYCRDWDKEY